MQNDNYAPLNRGTHNACNAEGSCNDAIPSYGFPELPEGIATISLDGGITQVDVALGWWIL